MHFEKNLAKILINEGKYVQAGQQLSYRNDPKFSDRYAWANSADPDQTAQGLHYLPFRLHRLDPFLYGRAT